MASNEPDRPIIIKRKKVVGGGGHHGGAWKVAYADFVTAMMAFFLLMWLLNATTEDQRKGLADYFTPTIPISRTSAGGAGMLAGVTIFSSKKAADVAAKGDTPKDVRRDSRKEAVEPGEKNLATALVPSDPSVTDLPAQGGEAEPAADEAAGAPPAGSQPQGAATPAEPATPRAQPDAEAAARAAAEQAERERLEKIGQAIAEAVNEAADGELRRHFMLQMTPEGLVIEVIDAADQPLFASASAEPAPILGILLDILVPVLGQTLNGIAVVGHTDAVPYDGAGYSNWELSADRANAARRMLAGRGLPDARIRQVTGKAAVLPLVADPGAPQNRRISITLLRQEAR